MAMINAQEARAKYPGINPDDYISSGGLFDESQFTRPKTQTFSSGIDTAKLLADQQAKIGAFTTKLGTVPSALQGLETELGIPQARNAFQSASTTAQGVAGQIRDVAPTQGVIAKQVGISAPRLQQRVASETGKLQPSLETATRGVEAAQSGLSSLLGTYNTRAEGIFKPLDIEAGLLGDSVKNEFDLYKSETKNALDLELANLVQTGLNDRAALDRASKLAEAEKAASSGSFVDLGNRYALIDPSTGQEISSFTKGLAPKSGNAATPLQYLGESDNTTPSYFTPVG